MSRLCILKPHFATHSAIFRRHSKTACKHGKRGYQNGNAATHGEPIPMRLEKVLLGSHYLLPFFFFLDLELSSVSGGVRKS